MVFMSNNETCEINLSNLNATNFIHEFLGLIMSLPTLLGKRMDFFFSLLFYCFLIGTGPNGYSQNLNSIHFQIRFLSEYLSAYPSWVSNEYPVTNALGYG